VTTVTLKVHFNMTAVLWGSRDSSLCFQETM